MILKRTAGAAATIRQQLGILEGTMSICTVSASALVLALYTGGCLYV